MEELQQEEKHLDISGPIFNITGHGFQELQKAGLTLDQLFYLETVIHKIDLRELVTRDKVLTWRQSLIRKGFLLESGDISDNGKTLLWSVGSGVPFKTELEKKQESVEEDFERWWKIYPASDIFEYKGRKFDGSRAMKLKKQECKGAFIKIINEGEVTANDLIRALEYEIFLKKEASVRERQNNLKYLKNTMSYLNGRLYEGFLESSKAEISPIQSSEDI